LLAASENPKVVSERLGHASIPLTMDIYSHVMPDMQQGPSAKLERMLFTKTGTQERQFFGWHTVGTQKGRLDFRVALNLLI